MKTIELYETGHITEKDALLRLISEVSASDPKSILALLPAKWIEQLKRKIQDEDLQRHVVCGLDIDSGEATARFRKNAKVWSDYFKESQQ